ncbi:MAG: TonB-dependent receptor [Deltaproteobacteria bacterium]|nr:TonB-dependent receptor [Deltaproteobacteria bacterium]
MQRLSFRTFYCLFIFGWIALPFVSEAGEQSLGEVTVRADTEEGGFAPVHDSISFSSVITAKELKGRRTSLPEVLEQSSGVQVRHLGGLDDFATVSIRGSTSEQVAVYVDGILINQAAGRGVNLATIPTDQIERIEVYKGAAPARFGSSAMGGVVNIVTKKGRKPRETRLIQSFGSFNTYEGTLLHAQNLKKASYQVGYTYSRSAGDFTFLDDNGTPFNTSDDQITTRKNNNFARHNVLTKLGLPSSQENGLEFDFQNQFFREDRGIPGLATRSSTAANLSTTRNGFSFEVSKKVTPRLKWTLSPSFQFLEEQFRDPQGEISPGPQEVDNKTLQYGSSLGGLLGLGEHQSIDTRLEYRGEQFLGSAVRNNVSLGVEDEIVLFGEKFILTPSIRTEHIFSHNENSETLSLHPVSGKVGIKYRPSGGENPVTFKTNFSRSYRVPNFTELFGNRGSFIGNPNLVPEKGWNWDIGGTLHLHPVRFEASYFLNHVEDLIQFLQTSQFTVRAENLSRARIQGVEASVATTLWEHWDISGSYTFQWAKDTSGLPGVDGKFLPGRAKHDVSTQTALHNKLGKIYSDLNFTDGNFLDTQNILSVNSRLILNAGASIHFFKHFTAGVESKNILDNRLVDIVGFPLPGRSYYGKLEIEI